jgi:hypothetical protein
MKRWDLKQCLLSVPDRKLSDLYELIILALGNSTAVKVRTLTEKSTVLDPNEIQAIPTVGMETIHIYLYFVPNLTELCPF